MYFQGFEIILDLIQEIEENLKNNPSEQEKESLINSLLNLRNIMDQCVKYWLYLKKRLMSCKKNIILTCPMSSRRVFSRI